MEAANALTNLKKEEEKPAVKETTETPKEEEKPKEEEERRVESATTEASSKRFIPDHKKPDAALTFPEKVCFPAYVGFLLRSTSHMYCIKNREPCISVLESRVVAGNAQPYCTDHHDSSHENLMEIS